MIKKLLRIRLLRWLVQLAPLVVFGLLFWFSDWERLTGLLRASRVGLLAAAALAALASTAAQAASWRRLLAAQGWNTSPARCWTAHLAGLFLGRLTPNHLGEWAKVAYVLEGPAGRGLATVAGEKILRAALLVACGPLAVLWLSDTNWTEAVERALRWPGPGGWGLLIVGLALAAGLITALHTGWLRLPGMERFASLWRDFLQGLAALRSRETAGALLWMAASLAAFSLQASLVGRALAIELPTPTLVACHMLALAVFTLVPISAGGFGTEEVVVLALFASLGVSLPAATAYAMLNIALLNILLPAAGALVWLARPIPLPLSGGSPDPTSNASLRAFTKRKTARRYI